MFKNYFKIAFRNLIRNKSYAFISVFGLAIGMAVCILLLLYVQHELSYDRFHENSDNIYRLCQPEHPYHAPQTGKILGNNLPEIKNYARILVRGEVIVQHNENKFKEAEYVFADASLFQIFSFQFKHGNPETALQQPFSIVISEKIAHKYFGNQNPIGQVFRLDNENDYTIAGVIEDMPQNSHFRYDLFATLTNADNVFGAESMNSMGWENFLIYFLIKDEFSPSVFAEKCNQVISNYRNSDPNRPKPEYAIQPLKDIHLYSSHFKNDIQPQNSITYVLIFSAIGMLILLIACFNFINMATANASTRAKEIGIKKVVGATREQIAKQFFGESFVVIFLSLFLALIIVETCLPIFNTLAGKVLSSAALLQMNTIFGIIGIILITSILAGVYPAFFISAFQPIRLLKKSEYSGKSNFNFRKILVGTQFTIVIILIFSAILMYRQIDFLQKKKLGFNKEYVLISEVDSFEDVEKYNSLKQALLEQSVVSSVSCASRVPSDDLNNWGSLIPAGKTDWISFPIVHLGFDYFETLGITTKQGRLFSNELKTDANDAIILNQAAVINLGLQGNPVGQSIQCAWPHSNRKIVGIVKDIHFESLYEQIRPTMFVIYQKMCRKILIKVKPSNATNSINTIKEICQKFYPDQIFEFHFLDDRFESLYQSETNTFKLMGYFTALAIFIACMGLFGMASFLIKRRTKEIGIRKTLGASILQILVTLSSDFTKWVLIANIFAWPIAWYAINQWLQNFAYRIDIGLWIFIISGALALIFALMAVGYQATKTAIANPIESLRYE